MASERCAERLDCRGNLKLGTMGSPFTAIEFKCIFDCSRTRRGQCREVLAKRSGNTVFSPSSYFII